MTLVGTNPHTPQPSPTLEMPHLSTEMSRIPIAKAVAEIGRENEMPIVLDAHVSPPPTQRFRQTNEQEERSAPLVEDRVKASSASSPAPAPRPPAAKKRARRPKTAPVAQTEAPYRNTRSRSRSVEPSVIPGQLIEHKARNKRKKDQSQLEPLHESVQEGERAELIMPETTAPISRTLEEERDVENLLVTTSHFSGATASGIPDVEDVETATSGAPNARSKPRVLDSDDEQTRHDLREANGQPSSQYPTSKYANMGPQEVLRRFNAKLPIASQSRQSSTRPVQPSLPSRFRRQDISFASSIDRRIVESTQTPRRFLQTREKSTSSTESFPVAGTRARDIKKKYEEVEKSSPYKPPAGTRAAQYVLTR